MDRVVKFSGAFLWSMVFMTVAFSYTAINYSNDLNLEDLCDEGEYGPQKMLDSELVQLLSDLNELRLISKDNDSIKRSNDLKWINSCAGWVMVEMKSRVFEKKLQKPQRK
jgi:hypothetical protein